MINKDITELSVRELYLKNSLKSIRDKFNDFQTSYFFCYNYSTKKITFQNSINYDETKNAQFLNCSLRLEDLTQVQKNKFDFLVNNLLFFIKKPINIYSIQLIVHLKHCKVIACERNDPDKTQTIIFNF